MTIPKTTHTTSNIIAIIVTYNGSKTICECLTSLQNSRHKVQTIVVDNASTDNTQALVQSFPDVILLQLERNIGFGLGNNIGIKLALDHNADYIFLLNQDAEVNDTTIGQLLQFAINNPDCGIISPLHLNGDGSEMDTKFIGHIKRGNPRFFSDAYFNRLQPSYYLPYINAAAWLIPSGTIKKVGNFSDLFFMYCEDDDYCYRVILNGFRIALLTEAIIYHKRISNIPTQTGWGEVKLKALREASNAFHALANNPMNFNKLLLYWSVNHCLRIVKALADLRWKNALILLVTKLIVLIKLPKIVDHRSSIHKVVQNSII